MPPLEKFSATLVAGHRCHRLPMIVRIRGPGSLRRRILLEELHDHFNGLLELRIVALAHQLRVHFYLLIPMKAVSDSDLIPVTRSDAMPVKIGAQRRWRPYRA